MIRYYICFYTITIMLGYSYFAVAANSLNDTGITTCSNDIANRLPCPVLNYPGQDAEFGRDKTRNTNNDGLAGFSFTKISQTGKPLPNDAPIWYCLRDNVTGITWELKTNDGGLHHEKWTYSWYEPNSSKNGGYAGLKNGGKCGNTSPCDTFSYVKAVNAKGWCGSKKWRLPTRQELRSFVGYDIVGPATVLWSSSPRASKKPVYAWGVDINGGDDSWNFKYDSYPVVLIHSGL